MSLQDLLKKLNSFLKDLKISDIIRLLINGKKDILIFVFSFVIMVFITVFIILRFGKDTRKEKITKDKYEIFSQVTNNQDVYLSFEDKLNLVQNVLVYPDSINKDLTSDYVNFITPTGKVLIQDFNREIEKLVKIEIEDGTLFDFERGKK